MEIAARPARPRRIGPASLEHNVIAADPRRLGASVFAAPSAFLSTAAAEGSVATPRP